MTKVKHSGAAVPNQLPKRPPWPRIDPPRPLTEREREVLTFLVSQSFSGHEELQSQIPVARVWVQEPGGATISLVVDRSAVPSAPVTRRVPVAAGGCIGKEQFCEVLLFVDEGYLSGLELIEYPVMIRRENAEFPPPTSLNANIPTGKI